MTESGDPFLPGPTFAAPYHLVGRSGGQSLHLRPLRQPDLARVRRGDRLTRGRRGARVRLRHGSREHAAAGTARAGRPPGASLGRLLHRAHPRARTAPVRCGRGPDRHRRVRRGRRRSEARVGREPVESGARRGRHPRRHGGVRGDRRGGQHARHAARPAPSRPRRRLRHGERVEGADRAQRPDPRLRGRPRPRRRSGGASQAGHRRRAPSRCGWRTARSPRSTSGSSASARTRCAWRTSCAAAAFPSATRGCPGTPRTRSPAAR